MSAIPVPEPLPRPAVQRTGDELAEEAACLPQTETAEEPAEEVLSDPEEPEDTEAPPGGRRAARWFRFGYASHTGQDGFTSGVFLFISALVIPLVAWGFCPF